MPEIKLELTLPDGPKSPFVIVAGGADANHDGEITEPDEVGAFAREGNVWTLKQVIADPLKGTKFCVIFAVGQDVRWEFRIKDAAGKELYSNQNTTVFHTGEIRWAIS